MAKAKAITGKIPALKPVEPKTVELQKDTIISWGKKGSPWRKGFMIGGYITKTDKRMNKKFGNESIIHSMDVAECSDKKFANSGDVVKMYEPAALRDLLSEIDTKGYIRIRYFGKNEDGEHEFKLDAERFLAKRK